MRGTGGIEATVANAGIEGDDKRFYTGRGKLLCKLNVQLILFHNWMIFEVNVKLPHRFATVASKETRLARGSGGLFS